MPIKDLLLPEFDQELRKTRALLERIPDAADKQDFKPHERSTPMAKLAAHIAQLPSLLIIMLSTPGYDAAKPEIKPLVVSSGAQLLALFDKLSAEAHALLENTTDRAMHENWRYSVNGRMLFDSSRYDAIRTLFFNHIIHHRAQLGVYLRLNNVAIPGSYGPSADDTPILPKSA
jgi:uncharacterized damage-inducible protein DinB